MIGIIAPGSCIYKLPGKNVNTNLHGNNIIDLQLVDGVFTKLLRNQFVNTATALAMENRQIDMRIDDWYSLCRISIVRPNLIVSTLIAPTIIKTLLKGITSACIGYAVLMAGVFTQIFFLATAFNL